MRSKLAVLAGVGVLAVALTACASGDAPEASSGGASDTIVATGDFGTTPKIEFPTPLKTDATECSVLIEGDGEPLQDGQYVQFGMAVLNGTTGDLLQAAGFDDGAPLSLTLPKTLPGLAKGLSCATEGSRVAIVVPPDEAFGPQGDAQLGLDGTDNLVLVVDVQRAFPARADGAVRLSQDGFPAVVLAPDGRPGITVPKSEAPDEFRLETLQEGSGEVVEDGDSVLVHYTGVLWDDNEVFDSSWAAGSPKVFTVGPDGQVIEGFTKALVGQKVGSQVVAIIPPELAYGDQASASVPAGSTLVFVIDILGVI